MSDLSPPPISGPLVDLSTGNGTPSFKDWLVRIFNRAGGSSDDLAPANSRYILASSDLNLPNAQALNLLDDGFLKQSGGTISSTGSNSIETSDLAATGVTANSYGDGQTVPVFTVGVDGRITTVTNISITNISPSGTASGDLSGSYPNPVVAQIQSVAVSSTNATAVSNLTGVNSGDQTITLSGVISGSGTGAITTTFVSLPLNNWTYTYAGGL